VYFQSVHLRSRRHHLNFFELTVKNYLALNAVVQGFILRINFFGIYDQNFVSLRMFCCFLFTRKRITLLHEKGSMNFNDLAAQRLCQGCAINKCIIHFKRKEGPQNLNMLFYLLAACLAPPQNSLPALFIFINGIDML